MQQAWKKNISFTDDAGKTSLLLWTLLAINRMVFFQVCGCLISPSHRLCNRGLWNANVE
jgi:hypothetical protein